MTQKDITGQKFGRLTAIKSLYIKNKKWYWLFKCDCGKECVIQKRRAVSGNTKSCGCIRKNVLINRNKKHLMSNTKLYKVYAGIKERCSQKYGKNYKYYAKKGINICNEWEKDFLPFYNWAINNGYKEGLTIDRIDSNKGYSPDNCRWVTMKEQNRNKSNNRLINYNGIIHCVTDWEKITGIKRKTICGRLERNWTIKDALTTPPNK